MSGVAIRASKAVQFSLLDLLDQLFAAEEVCSGCFRVLNLVARGDDGDDLGLAEAVGQNDRAADHLVGVLGVDAETHGQVDGLVELGVLGFLEERNCVRQNIRTGLNERARLLQILRDLSHLFPCLPPLEPGSAV